MARSNDLLTPVVNVQSMLDEIARLKKIKEVAKTADPLIRRLNELVALYGPPATNGATPGNVKHPGEAPCPVDGCVRVFRGKFNRTNVRSHFLDYHPRMGERKVEAMLDEIRAAMT